MCAKKCIRKCISVHLKNKKAATAVQTKESTVSVNRAETREKTEKQKKCETNELYIYMICMRVI